MKTYDLYLAPSTFSERETKSGKIIKKKVANGAKQWERIGTINVRNKTQATKFLKLNTTPRKGFVYVLLNQKLQEK